jgi:four helix bundle protein
MPGIGLAASGDSLTFTGRLHKECVRMDSRVRTHKDLLVWQESIALAERVYVLTRAFPPEERFGLTAQTRRAAVSISSNIAEGAARASSREYANYLSIARASWAELDTQALYATIRRTRVFP